MSEAASASSDVYRGTKIGRYSVLSQLTTGGMAELFLGYTAGPGGFRKYVVLKRILPDAKNNDQFVKMFLDEARVTAGFTHPNIAQVYELGEEETDLYLSMEFIAGQNLNQVTAECAKKRAVLPIGFSAATAHDIALALHYAHTFADPAGIPLGVIHRDVAQKNIMVTYDGTVKLTTGYMSPEQVRGEPLDGRSDVFSLGVVLFEMITGRRLFSADSEIEEMKMILNAPIPRPSSLVPVIPDSLSDVVLRALAREKADRWGSAKEFAKGLKTQCEGLLYDQEARSMFMREHFADQMQATAALLQSVNDSSAKHQVLAKAVKAIRGDGGAMSNAQRLSKDEVKVAKARPKKKKEKESDTDAELARLAAQAEGLGAGGPAPALTASSTKTNPNASRPMAWAVPLLLLVALGLLGGALYRVAFNGPSEPKADQPFYDTPVPIPHGPDDGKGTEAMQNNPPAQQQPSAKDPVKDDKKPLKVRGGTVTLVTFPEATVFRGNKEIGKTPLFNAELPIGTHMLTLVGADGVRHVLSVPVHEGKNPPLKVKLDELPSR